MASVSLLGRWACSSRIGPGTVVSFLHSIAHEQEGNNGVCLYLMESEKHNDTQGMYDYIDRPRHFNGES
jgi:hypothetical protein